MKRIILATCLITQPMLYATPNSAELFEKAQMGHFEGIEEAMAEADDEITEARKILHGIIVEVNKQHGLKLTLPQVCDLVRKNIDLFDLPVDREEFLLMLDLIESETPASIDALLSSALFIWPWQWAWFRQWFGLPDMKASHLAAAKLSPEGKDVLLFSILCITAITVVLIAPTTAGVVVAGLATAAAAACKINEKSR